MKRWCFIHQEYLPNVHNYQEVQWRSGILGMLDLGYTHFYIDGGPEIEPLLSPADKPLQSRATDLVQCRFISACR